MFTEILLLVNLVNGIIALSTNVTLDGLGNVIGIEEYTKWTNRTIYSFRGIRYAKPPIDELRFAPPVSFTWNGTLDAREHGNVCPQTGDLGTYTYDEDCLTLNVYVPRLNNESEILPVMIWIHGGTFMTGHSRIYEPHFILEKDVVLVVIQFRLGPLGLLSLQTDEIPGNVQFLDQIMAMQWVQDHIGSFGGDPNQVTLFGQSSGAASVNLHQFSPLSRGLFHRVIIQSGSAVAPWVMDYNPVQTATRLGAVVGCNETNVTLLATCFKELDVQTLITGFDTYLAYYTLGGLTEIGGHRAVVQTAGSTRFLEEDPSTLLARSEYAKVPMIGGATKHDGIFPLASYYLSYFLPNSLTNNTEFLQYDLISFVAAAFGISDASGGISQTFINAHFEEDHIGDFLKMVPGLTDLCSVLAFKSGVFRMLQANSRVNTSYLYRFGHYGENKAIGQLGNFSFQTGVGHSDDLFYLFPISELSDDDVIVAKRMVSLWTSFAISGEPKTDDQTWPSMNTAFGPYLIIDDELLNGTNYLSEHTAALREGMTADIKSLAHVAVPQTVVTLAVALWSILKI